MSEIESRTPKPVTNRAVQPAMPTTVMKKRFLYRNRLRAVTLWVKRMRRQTGRICSSKMRLPAFGAFGSIRLAGCSRSSAQQSFRVASRVQATAVPVAMVPKSVLKGVFRTGRSYMIL